MEFALSLVRNLLSAGGTALATHGLMSNDQASAIVGALSTLIGVGLSMWNAYKARKNAQPK